MMVEARDKLAEKIAGEIALSENPGATLRKWRTDFEIAQNDLAAELDVSVSVISDYETGRRENPGSGTIRRTVNALLDIDEYRGGKHIRQHARALSAGLDSDIILDLHEYRANVSLQECYDSIEATELAAGNRDTVAGHTVVDSVQAIRHLSSREFYNLYGQSTNRALVFTNNTSGKGALIALRVINPTPNAVVLHGVSEDELWEFAPELARGENISLAVTTIELDSLLERLREAS